MERFRALTSSSLRDANVLVFMFDLTSSESFRKLQEWLAECQRYGAKKKFIKVLIGAKCDLIDQRTVTEVEARSFAMSNGLTYFETSSKDGEGVDDSVQCIARKVLRDQLQTICEYRAKT